MSTVNPGGIFGGSSELQLGHGMPGAPHVHARGEGPKSDGKRECASQTQNVSSQRAHFGVIAIAPAQGSAALAEEKQPLWIFCPADFIGGLSCVEVVQPRQNL
jgi:hypothetical protein